MHNQIGLSVTVSSMEHLWRLSNRQRHVSATSVEYPVRTRVRFPANAWPPTYAYHGTPKFVIVDLMNSSVRTPTDSIFSWPEKSMARPASQSTRLEGGANLSVIVSPHADHFDHTVLLNYLIHKSMLNTDSSGIRAAQVVSLQ